MHDGVSQPWKLRLLGAFALVSPAGAGIVVAERKARAMLAYVALSREHRVSRDTLVDLLWQDSPAAQGRQSLRQVLHRLRDAMGEPDVLCADKQSVGVDPLRLECDVLAFLGAAQGDGPEDLRRAAALFRVPLLAELDVDAPEFDGWLRSMRLQLSQAGCAVFRRLAIACQAAGDLAGAIKAGDQWIAADPCDEEGYRLLLQLHAAAGDRASLKATFAALNAMCESQLDSAPTEDTVRLYRELLGDTPFPRLVAQPAGAARERQAAPPMVAVLRWQCAREDPEQAYLTDAICEELMLTLGSMRSMRVVARGASFQVPAEIDEAVSQGRALGADYLVGGSLRRIGDRIRVAAWLADAASGEVVWSRRYHEAVEDLFALHEELACRIAASLEPSVNRVELRAAQRRPPRDLDAYDLLQRGYWHFYQGDFENATRRFTEAIARDPAYAHAHAMLALATYSTGQVKRTPDWPQLLRMAYDTAQRASLLDPDDAKAHLALGQTASWLGRYEESAEALSRAATLNPSLGQASSARAFLSLMQGDFEAAIRATDVAVRFRQSDPGLGLCLPGKAMASYFLGDYAGALDVVRRALSLKPGFWFGEQVLAATLGRIGHADEAAPVLRNIRGQAFESDALAFAARVPYADARWAQQVSEGLAEAGWR